MDICGRDPGAAAASWTVDSVFGGVFLVFFIPLYFEAQIEELLYVLERNVLWSAAAGRHMGRIVDGHGEYSSEAGVTHAVAARKFGGSRDGYVVRHTSQACHSMVH